jgi:hypothetical protein
LILLPHNPRISNPPLLLRLRRPNLTTHHRHRHQLVYLQYRNVLAQTRPLPRPECQNMLLDTLGVCIDPPRGIPNFGILFKNTRVTVPDPGIHANDRAGREECVAELQTGGGYDAFQVETEGGVHAEVFFDDSGETLELLVFGPGGEGK